ncbi:uncharacterized protein [Haliotis cracherodii]|uniref:uncharacterized protein n=1 Tax=Haliotis cracherodii TaxID=6455 RepID=UPI0039EAE471
MPTGDLKNNLRKLQTEIKLMKYPESVDIKGLTQGDAKAFMPILHHGFTSYSTKLAEEIAAKDIVLFAKSDATFIDSIYKILRDMFSYKPLVTKDQFFSTQFAERKIIMVTEVLQRVQKHCRTTYSSKPSSAFKLNSSMDNIARPPSGRIRPKSAATGTAATTATKKEPAKSSTSMPPPRALSATNAAAKKTTLNRSASAMTHVELSKYRSPSIRSSLPGPGKPRVIKEVIDPNQSCDSLFSLYTPSIARVKPRAVEVVNMPKPQGNESAIDAAAASPTTPLSEPVAAVNGDSRDGMNTNAAVLCFQELNEKINNIMSMLEAVDSRVGQMEAMFDLQKSIPATQEPVLDMSRWNNADARLKLLENRMLILESRMPDPDKVKMQSPPISSSPVTPVSAGKTGAFVTIESFVNGESKVRKMAREAEAKIRSHSADDDLERVSPIRKPVAVELPSNKGGQDEMFTLIPDPEPNSSSTPTKGMGGVGLKYVDTPTHNQAQRIEHLMQSTESMLKPVQTEIPAEEVQRQDVD